MSTGTQIEWATDTWNPIVGCSPTSRGCKNCYAMPIAARLGANRLTPHYAGTAKVVNGRAVFTGHVARAPESVLLRPLKQRSPRRIFVNSMGDLFHENVPDDWIDQVMAVMALAPQHTFLVLTKRAARMRAYFANRSSGDPWAEAADQLADMLGLHDHPSVLEPSDLPLLNVWLGVSVEDQKTADERVPDLLNTIAALRWVSAEPLLGPVDLTRICLVPTKPGSDRAGIHIDALRGRYVESGLAYTGDWDVDGEPPPDSARLRLQGVVSGGESGSNGRTHHPAWHTSLRDQCAAAGTAYDFKQWGRWAPLEQVNGRRDWMIVTRDGDADIPDDRWPDEDLGECAMAPIGKRNAGRLLDGRIHDGFTRMGRE